MIYIFYESLLCLCGVLSKLLPPVPYIYYSGQLYRCTKKLRYMSYIWIHPSNALLNIHPSFIEQPDN